MPPTRDDTRRFDQSAPRRSSWRANVTYAVLVLSALLPLLLAWPVVLLPPSTRWGGWQAALQAEMAKIEFGSGWRFWFGVTGTSIMALLLLYPLRKRLGVRAGLSVGGAFHTHIILGLLGPILILYHCNLGLGSFRANVALTTMLAVVASGLIGHYVYARLSRGYYDEQRTAQALLDDLKLRLQDLGQGPGQSSLLSELDALAAAEMTPPAAPWSRLAAWVRLASRRRRVTGQIHELLAFQVPARGWSQSDQMRYRAGVGLAAKNYVAASQVATRRAMAEYLGRAWRLMHLPLFAVTAFAIAAHVYAVWGMEPATHLSGGEVASVSETAARAGPVAIPTPSPAKRAVIAQKPVSTTPAKAAPAKPVPADPGAAKPAPAPALAAPPALEPAPVEDGPQLISPPALVRRAGDPPAATMPSAVPQAPPRPAKPVAAPASDPPPAAAVPPPVVAASVAGSMAELARRTASLPLPQRLVTIKAAPGFDHSQTRFPLTGRHVKVDCGGCHVQTITDTSRSCVSCHRKDDRHRGRRPNCENCHTVNSWSDTSRRR
jgi:hypothetical protein